MMLGKYRFGERCQKLLFVRYDRDVGKLLHRTENYRPHIGFGHRAVRFDEPFGNGCYLALQVS